MLRGAAWLVVALPTLVACGRVGFDAAGDGDAGVIDPDADAGPAGALTARIKSVQRFDLTLTTTPLLVPITPVDTSRSFVLCSVRTPNSAAATRPTCELVATNMIRVTNRDPSTSNFVSMQVVEFTGAVRVQRGTEDLISGSEAMRQVAIAGVDRAKTFVLVSQHTDYQFNDGDSRFAVSGELSASDQLLLRRTAVGSGSLVVHWQVIEIDGIEVLAQTGQIMGGEATYQVTFSQPYERDTTFAIASTRATSDIEAEYLTRVGMPTDTTMLFARTITAASTVDVSWFRIRVPGARVQHAFANLTTETIADHIHAPVDLDRSFIVSSFSGGQAGVNNDLDASLITVRALDAATVRVERGMGSNVGAVAAWAIVEWPP